MFDCYQQAFGFFGDEWSKETHKLWTKLWGNVECGMIMTSNSTDWTCSGSFCDTNKSSSLPDGCCCCCTLKLRLNNNVIIIMHKLLLLILLFFCYYYYYYYYYFYLLESIIRRAFEWVPSWKFDKKGLQLFKNNQWSNCGLCTLDQICGHFYSFFYLFNFYFIFL